MASAAVFTVFAVFTQMHVTRISFRIVFVRRSTCAMALCTDTQLQHHRLVSHIESKLIIKWYIGQIAADRNIPSYTADSTTSTESAAVTTLRMPSTDREGERKTNICKMLLRVEPVHIVHGMGALVTRVYVKVNRKSTRFQWKNVHIAHRHTMMPNYVTGPNAYRCIPLVCGHSVDTRRGAHRTSHNHMDDDRDNKKSKVTQKTSVQTIDALCSDNLLVSLRTLCERTYTLCRHISNRLLLLFIYSRCQLFPVLTIRSYSVLIFCFIFFVFFFFLSFSLFAVVVFICLICVGKDQRILKVSSLFFSFFFWRFV